MRSLGTRVELIRLRPHDHIGWVFSGADELAWLARPYLAEGAELGERLMFVTEDPGLDVYRDVTRSFDPAGLDVLSISDVYGSSGVVDAEAQRATFATAMSGALADGYSGIRVAADNSPLVATPERMEAWLRWELVADHFMAANRVTGLCAFDRDRVGVDDLRHLATLHPLTSADEPMPQFRLFVEEDSLRIEGDVDVFAVEQLVLALRALPPKTPVCVDLRRATLRGRRPMAVLEVLAGQGVPVTVLDEDVPVDQPV